MSGWGVGGGREDDNCFVSTSRHSPGPFCCARTVHFYSLCLRAMLSADAGRMGAHEGALGEPSARAFFLGLVETAVGAADACAEAVAAAAAAGAALIKEPV